MGLRACAIKRYVVEYGDTRGFNWGADTLANIIGDFCDSFYCGSDYPDVDVTWEVDSGEFAAMIKDIAAMKSSEFKQKMEEWHVDTLDDEYTTKGYVLEKLRTFYKEADKSDGYVRIGWL